MPATVYMREYEYSLDFLHVETKFVEDQAVNLNRVFTIRSTGTVKLFSESKYDLPESIHRLKPTQRGIHKFLKNLKYDAIAKYKEVRPGTDRVYIDNVHLVAVNKFTAPDRAFRVQSPVN